MKRVSPSPGSFSERWRVPGDKSLSHRSLILASMASGTSLLSGLSTGADVLSTAACLRSLGAQIPEDWSAPIRCEGWGEQGPSEPIEILDCGNSGTAMRLLLGLCAAYDHLHILTGDASLSGRPMGRVVEPLRAMGAQLMARQGDKLAPLVVRGGGLQNFAYEQPVASAQVKSCLLLAGLGSGVEVDLKEPGLSRDHTERMLSSLGVPLEYGPGWVRLPRAYPPHSFEGFEMDVPSDPSSAAFLVAATLLTPGSSAVLEHVALNPTRLGFFEILKRMGAELDWTVTQQVLGEPVGHLEVRHSSLTGVTVLEDEIPRAIDEFPLLAVLATQAEGSTVLRGAAELRHKESDRISTVVEGLQALGAVVEEFDDGFTVTGATDLREATLACHHDHRLEMSWAVAGLLAPVEIEGHGWAEISFPNFWELFPGVVC